MPDRYVTFGDEFFDADGNTIRIVRDYEPMNPREWTTGTHFYTYDHNSPDKVGVWDAYRRKVVEDACSMIDILCEFMDYDDIWGNYEKFYESHGDEEEYPDEWMTELARKWTDTDYIPELVRFINTHGGWAKPISIGESDNGRVFCCNDPDGPYKGIIYMDKTGQAEVGTPDELVFEALEGDVINQNNYEACRVFGFDVIDDDGNYCECVGSIYPEDDSEWLPISAIEWHTGELKEE